MVFDPLIGKTLQNKYRIIELLGEGGMGRVYLAENAEFEYVRYAIKALKPEYTKIHPQFEEEFFKEASRQAQLKHPKIVQVIDYFKLNNNFYLVLSFIDGPTLSDLIDSEENNLTDKLSLSIIKDLLEALDYAHKKGYVHQDVKSQNILIDQACAHLTDFGIAREFSDSIESDKQRWVGTPEYMSPEQYTSPSKVDHRADVYAAGIVMFEALTGQLPFTGPTVEEILRKQVDEPAPNPRLIKRTIPKSLARIILKALEKDPDKRYQGCQEFLQAIVKYEHHNKYIRLVITCLVLTAAGALAYAIWKPPVEAGLKLVVEQAYDKHQRICMDTSTQQKRVASIGRINKQIKLAEERLALERDEYSDSKSSNENVTNSNMVITINNELRSLEKTKSNLNERMKELDMNMSDAFQQYKKAISNMQKFDQDIVLEMVRTLEKEKSGRLGYSDFILQDEGYLRPATNNNEQQRHNKGLLSLEKAVKRCKSFYSDLN